MTLSTLQQQLFNEQLETLASTWTRQPDKPDESLDVTLRTLWFAAAGDARSAARSGDGEELPALQNDGVQRLRQLVERRKAGIPLAYITGRQNFMGMEMLTGPEALIPRRETELLGQAALDAVRSVREEQESVIAMDVCTGSGNVALTMTVYEPMVRVYASDISDEAVQLARRNAAMLGVADRITFAVGDLFAPFEHESIFGHVDVLTCNPPYMSSGKVSSMPTEITDFEPHVAFDGGLTGMSVISRLLTDAPQCLRPGGWLCFEVGAANGIFIATRLRRNPTYVDVRTACDADGQVRTVIARTRTSS